LWRLYEEGIDLTRETAGALVSRLFDRLGDLEVVHEARQGHLWHIKYRWWYEEFLVGATTRPKRCWVIGGGQ